jgi:CRP/FNR family transcriptional regulator, anaerobic regulatory protein
MAFTARRTESAMTQTHHSALDSLPAELRESALREAHAVELPVGARIFGPGDACAGLPLVISGSVRVQMTGASGNEIVLYRIGPDDMCTLSIGCLMAQRSYAAEAIVEEPTRGLLLPATLFDRLMDASAAFRRHIMSSYGSRLDSLMLLVEEVAFRRMDRRLAHCLLERSRGSSVEATHQHLAAELGTAREVVSRVLKELERGQVVRLERGRIEILDRERLQRIAESP